MIDSLPPRDGTRRAVAQCRRRDRTLVRSRRRPACSGDAAAGGACAGDGSPARARRARRTRPAGTLCLRPPGKFLSADAARVGGRARHLRRRRAHAAAAHWRRIDRRLGRHGGFCLARDEGRRNRHGPRQLGLGQRGAGGAWSRSDPARSGGRQAAPEFPHWRRPGRVEEPARLGRAATGHAAEQPAGGAARGPPAARANDLGRRQHRRGAADAERLRLRRVGGLRAA